MRLSRFWGASLDEMWRVNTDLSGEASFGDDIGRPDWRVGIVYSGCRNKIPNTESISRVKDRVSKSQVPVWIAKRMTGEKQSKSRNLDSATGDAKYNRTWFGD